MVGETLSHSLAAINAALVYEPTRPSRLIVEVPKVPAAMGNVGLPTLPSNNPDQSS